MNQLPETPIGTLRLFASTQTQIDVFSDSIIQAVKEGEANPLEVLIQIKALQKVSDRVLKEINDNLLNEANKYSETNFEFMGAKIEKAELGTKYDYASCGDTEYEMLDSQMNSLKQRIKEREDFLKSIKQDITLVDNFTGEVVTVHPPIKKSTSGLKVSIR